MGQTGAGIFLGWLAGPCSYGWYLSCTSFATADVAGPVSPVAFCSWFFCIMDMVVWVTLLPGFEILVWPTCTKCMYTVYRYICYTCRRETSLTHHVPCMHASRARFVSMRGAIWRRSAVVFSCNVASHSTHLRPQDTQTGWWLSGCWFSQEICFFLMFFSLSTPMLESVSQGELTQCQPPCFSTSCFVTPSLEHAYNDITSKVNVVV